MSGEQFLRAHGWKLGRNLWWHDRLPEQGHQFEVALLRQAQWLAADVPTSEERDVLEAMKLVPVTWLEMAVGSSQITRGLAPLAAAELARRAAKSRRDQVEQVRTVVEEAERIAKEAKGG